MNEVGFLFLVGCSFPLAFYISRLCLEGVMRLLGEGQAARPIPHQ